MTIAVERLNAVREHAAALLAEQHDDDLYWSGRDVKRVLQEFIDLADGRPMAGSL